MDCRRTLYASEVQISGTRLIGTVDMNRMVLVDYALLKTNGIRLFKFMGKIPLIVFELVRKDWITEL